MLIDTSMTIAYKCPSCGSFKFFNISVFEVSYKNLCSFKCDCNESEVSAIRNSSGNFILSAPCIGCGGEHIINMDMNGILYREVNEYRCPSTGIEQCFIGKDMAVRKKIDKLEKELDKLIDMFGYDSYFKNTQVMFESLNKIHDIAEKGNLYCECGNSDIELSLLSDKIYLKCKKCSASRIIYAISNENLKDILMRQRILLCKGVN
ncbi:MAG: hypothetical protein ACOX7R_04815 [Acetivibrionales bacterium]